jgi:hypothetical protein
MAPGIFITNSYELPPCSITNSITQQSFPQSIYKSYAVMSSSSRIVISLSSKDPRRGLVKLLRMTDACTQLLSRRYRPLLRLTLDYRFIFCWAATVVLSFSMVRTLRADSDSFVGLLDYFVSLMRAIPFRNWMYFTIGLTAVAGSLADISYFLAPLEIILTCLLSAS